VTDPKVPNSPEEVPEDFEPDDDLLLSLPQDEEGGEGPDEPSDPERPDEAGD
jgi:hypothetical protein